MKMIRDIIPRRRPAGTAAPVDPAPEPPVTAAPPLGPADLRDLDRARSGREAVPRALDSDRRPLLQTMEDRPKAAPTIWDLEAEPGPPAPLAPPPPAEAAPPPAAAGRPDSTRVRTRLLGFAAARPEDAFAAPAAPAGETRFPVGWLVVAEGPGRGASFTLTAGLSTIGRGEDQAIRLDFGDTAISRDCHAAIVYDPEDRRTLIGHGGRSNIVRLNGAPLLAREELASGDVIRLGRTTLRYIGLCGAHFDWQDGAEADD